MTGGNAKYINSPSMDVGLVLALFSENCALCVCKVRQGIL